ncbi:MAG: dockerin type I repeat-containing protein [Oscillospiraceae bacterium]|nr:dockerin type I repeat-containing protein [Oscillospiraceae bacterium]MBR6837545.1 dockerin type I repeat-containing protein [Oscillospiraceae bacterium]MBR6923821.1 dockerin type I repeat-containing protein [Oscillospiraceae bacterium]
MKRNIFTAAAIGALLLLNSAVPVCSAAPDEVLDEAGVSYVMSGFKAYYLEDGVYYHNQGASADEYGAAVEIPPGEYHVTFKLLALSATYPEGKFAVRFKTDGGPDMFGAPESEATLKELERLHNAGVDAVIIEEKPETAYSSYLYAVLTADQINNFPVSEEFGYRLGFASKPEVPVDSTKLQADDNSHKTGDINGDKIIDVGDLSYLSLYLLGDKPLPEEWLKAADVDGDGDVTIADLARLQQYLSKKIDKL